MKYWVFDLDGTLVDSFGHYFWALGEILGPLGVVPTQEQLEVSRCLPSLRFFQMLLGEKEALAANERLAEYNRTHSGLIVPFEGIEEVLSHLHGKNRRLAVWTGRDLISAKHVLKLNGFDRYFEICVSGTCVQKNKPDPEGLLRVLKHFGCEAFEAVMVGDHHHDMLGAKTAGTKALSVGWSHDSLEASKSSDSHFSKVSELMEYVRARTD